MEFERNNFMGQNIEKYEKGFIEIGEEVMISDPCYEPGTWCQGIVKNMLPGSYRVGGEIVDCDTWGRRVSKIWILHEEYSEAPPNFNEEDFEVGVDSGQAGIYDSAYFHQQWKDKNTSEGWYSRVCDETFNKSVGFEFGTLDDKCVVSSSGFGDGSYTCYTSRNNDGKNVYVEIDFGVVEDDGDYEEDDDGDYNYDDENENI